MRDAVLCQNDKQNADTKLIVHKKTKKLYNELKIGKYNKDENAVPLYFDYMQNLPVSPMFKKYFICVHFG